MFSLDTRMAGGLQGVQIEDASFEPSHTLDAVDWVFELRGIALVLTASTSPYMRSVDQQ